MGSTRIPGPLGRNVNTSVCDGTSVRGPTPRHGPTGHSQIPTVVAPSKASSVTIETADQTPPNTDGQIKLYRYFDCTAERAKGLRLPDPLKRSQYFDSDRRVIFINGMDNKGTDHQDAAWMLSYIQMCPIIGVFNKTAGFFKDLGQCIADKWQFHGEPGDPKEKFNAQIKSMQQAGLAPDRAAVMIDVLSDNPAAVAMFRLLRSTAGKNLEIFAHSQGNLILSNALTAVSIVDSLAAIQGRKVQSFGSPALNWPPGIARKDHAFTFDPVSWLDPVLNFDVSKIGLAGHGFLMYMENDPEFVVNRYRWGSLGVTVSMDEEGLAKELVGMGNNQPRIRRIFEHLDKYHNSDVDDVALLYVNQLRSKKGDAQAKQFFATMKGGLVPLLIKVMDQGWTAADEKECITFLKSV